MNKILLLNAIVLVLITIIFSPNCTYGLFTFVSVFHFVFGLVESLLTKFIPQLKGKYYYHIKWTILTILSNAFFIGYLQYNNIVNPAKLPIIITAVTYIIYVFGIFYLGNKLRERDEHTKTTSDLYTKGKLEFNEKKFMNNLIDDMNNSLAGAKKMNYLITVSILSMIFFWFSKNIDDLPIAHSLFTTITNLLSFLWIKVVTIIFFIASGSMLLVEVQEHLLSFRINKKDIISGLNKNRDV